MLLALYNSVIRQHITATHRTHLLSCRCFSLSHSSKSLLLAVTRRSEPSETRIYRNHTRPERNGTENHIEQLPCTVETNEQIPHSSHPFLVYAVHCHPLTRHKANPRYHRNTILHTHPKINHCNFRSSRNLNLVAIQKSHLSRMALAAMQPRDVNLRNPPPQSTDSPQQPRLPSLAQLCVDDNGRQSQQQLAQQQQQRQQQQQHPGQTNNPIPSVSDNNATSAVSAPKPEQSLAIQPSQPRHALNPQQPTQQVQKSSDSVERQRQPNILPHIASNPHVTLTQSMPQPLSVAHRLRTSPVQSLHQPLPALPKEGEHDHLKPRTDYQSHQPLQKLPTMPQHSTSASLVDPHGARPSIRFEIPPPPFDLNRSHVMPGPSRYLPAPMPHHSYAQESRRSFSTQLHTPHGIHKQSIMGATRDSVLSSVEQRHTAPSFGSHPSASPGSGTSTYHHIYGRTPEVMPIRSQLVEKRKTDVIPPPGSNIKEYCAVLTPFIYKLYCLVSDENTNDLCRWSSQGDSFIVEDPTAFAATVLPNYFKHNQFSSFVRQLNKYRFHKLAPGAFLFGHERFIRGRPDLLPEIGRQRSPERVDKHPAMAPGGRTLVNLHPDYVKARNFSYRSPRDAGRLTSSDARGDVEAIGPYKRQRVRQRSHSPDAGGGGDGVRRGTGITDGIDYARVEEIVRQRVAMASGPLRGELDSLKQEYEAVVNRMKQLEEVVASMQRGLDFLQQRHQQQQQSVSHQAYGGQGTYVGGGSDQGVAFTGSSLPPSTR